MELRLRSSFTYTFILPLAEMPGVARDSLRNEGPKTEEPGNKMNIQACNGMLRYNIMKLK
jgi:hypothetical protein